MFWVFSKAMVAWLSGMIRLCCTKALQLDHQLDEGGWSWGTLWDDVKLLHGSTLMDVTLLIESNDLMFRYVNNDLVKSISFRFFDAVKIHVCMSLCPFNPFQSCRVGNSYDFILDWGKFHVGVSWVHLSGLKGKREQFNGMKLGVQQLAYGPPMFLINSTVLSNFDELSGQIVTTSVANVKGIPP